MRPHPLAIALAATLCATTVRAADQPASGATSGAQRLFDTAQVHFQNAQSQPVGEAVLRETPNGVVVTLDLRGLPPGEHGFHFHETGKCQAPFQTAGSHFNPTEHRHGFEVENGPHAGDLPNLFVARDGTVRTEFLARNLTLEPGKKNSLLDGDGAALIVHGGPDDYHTDPAGDSGDRIACGIVEKPQRAAKGSIVPQTAERPGGRPTPEAGAR